MMKAQCHCRECQYITGGSPNMFVVMPPDGFRYTKGDPEAVFAQRPREAGDTRILRRMRHACRNAAAGVPVVVIKGRHARRSRAQIMPQVAIYTVDKQPFHHIPDGMPSFERLPQR